MPRPDRLFGTVFDGQWWISDVQSDIWMHTNPAYNQTNFRFRNDDGDQAGASWKATAGTAISLAPGQPFRLRIQVSETAGGTGTITPTLYISKNGGAWTAGGSQSDVALRASANITNDAVTTEQLAGSQGFVAGRILESGWSGSTVTLTSQDSEYEWSLELAASGFNGGDTLDFRVQDGTTAFGTYTSVARINLSVGVNVDATGVSATAAVGTVTVTIPAIVSATGVATTASVGTVDVAVHQPVVVTGIEAVSSVGTVDVTGTAVVTQDGLGLTAAVGTVAVEIDVAPDATGLAMTASVGDVTVDTGVELTYLRPTIDISDGGWTTDTGGTDLYAAVDEASQSDSDYIRSSEGPSNDTCEIRLASGTDPNIHTDHTLRYRLRATKSARVTVRLMCGATEIASWQHDALTDSYEDAVQTLTEVQAGNITDYTDLRVRFTANLPA